MRPAGTRKLGLGFLRNKLLEVMTGGLKRKSQASLASDKTGLILYVLFARLPLCHRIET
jgi:hypothetical protein